MKAIFSEFLKDKIVKLSLIISVSLLLFYSIILGIFFKDIPPYVPVFNSMPWGEGRLFSASILFLAPVILFFIFLFNNAVGALLYKKYILVSRILSINSLLFLLIGIIGYIQILLLIY